MSRRPQLPSFVIQPRTSFDVSVSHRTVSPISLIDDGLFVGSVESLTSPILEKHGITHIVSLFDDASKKQKRVRDDKVLTIDMDDVCSQELTSIRETIIPFISKASSDGGKVLVHCQAGVSRSATVVAAFLILTRGMNFSSAMSLLRTRRPCVAPNFGFELFLRGLK